MAVALIGLLLWQLATVAALASRMAAAPVNAAEASTKTTASLKFEGSVSLASNPLPEGTTRRELSQFFQSPEARTAFASGGLVKNANEIPLTPQWEARWQECCDHWYGSSFLPEQGDAIFACDTFSQFPGLTVCTTVYTGFKTLTTGSTPSCCFLVIGQKQTATGLPPVVWIFHKLMGTKPEEEELPAATPATTVKEPWGPIQSFYSIEQQQSSQTGKIQWNFRLDSTMQMKLEFPGALLKSLPISTKRAEAQGSLGITKSIRKAGQKGTKAVHQAFLKYQTQPTSVEATGTSSRESQENTVGSASSITAGERELIRSFAPWRWVPILA